MLPADMRVFKASLETLSVFKSRVDAVLSDFEDSPGSAHKVGAHSLSRGSFSGGSGFGEANTLHTQYERVHEHLTKLSKNLGLHIEALHIAVDAAHGDFRDVDEEQRRRFYEIQTQISREKAAEQEAKQKHSDDKQSGAGY